MHHITSSIKVTDEEAMAMARWLVEQDGIFIGSSSAVNCVAAVRTALKLGPGKRVVTMLCDSGTRHLSKFWKEAGSVGWKDDLSLDDVLAGKWMGEEKKAVEQKVEAGEKKVAEKEEEENGASDQELRLPTY